MVIKIIQTNSTNPDFVALVAQLDAYLKTTDGDEHDFYNQFNGIEHLNHVLVAYNDGEAIACGAIKPKQGYGMEVKRMYTHPNHRGKGIAGKLLKKLEDWAADLGHKKVILETGKRQVEAVQFYKKCGYSITTKFPPYEAMENSICFEKIVSS